MGMPVHMDNVQKFKSGLEAKYNDASASSKRGGKPSDHHPGA
jgi:hypothetical protein